MECIIKIVKDTKRCFRSILDKICGKKIHAYTPVHLMRTEIEIESLLEESDELPQTRFIPKPEPEPVKKEIEQLRAIDSLGNVTSFDLDNMVSMTDSGFYSCDEEDVFGGSDMDFFHNTSEL